MLQPDLKKLKDTVDAELQKLGSKIAWYGLSDQMNYAFMSFGKRLRPIMTLLSTASVGGDIQEAKDFAIALELMHTATLVHDDVLDDDTLRRGLRTVHNQWSVGEAILAGDALLSLALSLIVNYDCQVIKVFSETGMLLAEGEYLDLVSFHELSERTYLERIERKSASLFKAATECGAIIGKASPLEVTALTKFGENFGMAYQIRDDVLDTIGVENGQISPDLRQQRVTLPIIYALSILNELEKNELLRNIERLSNENSVDQLSCFEAVIELLERIGAVDYCNNKVNFYVKSAVDNIQQLDNTVFKKNLLKMAESLVIPSGANK